MTITAGWAATRLPSTFFPEIDESMERVYVRFSPGISLHEANARIQEMAKMLARELPKGDVTLVLTNQGSPENARSAMTSTNDGPHMGFIRVALARARAPKALPARDRGHDAPLLNEHYPGVEFLQWPGGLVASVFSNGYYAPIAVELQNDNLEALEDQGKSRGGGRADGGWRARCPRTAADGLPRDPREHGPGSGRDGRAKV